MKNKVFMFLGTPGSGKSTWISENGLSYMTLRLDDVSGALPLVMKPDMNLHFAIGMKERISMMEKWAKRRMNFILDIGIYRKEGYDAYVELMKKYAYEVYLIDFSTRFTNQQLIENNRNRKIVGNELYNFEFALSMADLEGMKTRAENDDHVAVISSKDAISMINSDDEYVDLSEYSDVIVIGNGKHHISSSEFRNDAFYILMDDGARFDESNIVYTRCASTKYDQSIYHIYYKFAYKGKKYVVSWSDTPGVPKINSGYNIVKGASDVPDVDKVCAEYEKRCEGITHIFTSRRNLISGAKFDHSISLNYIRSIDAAPKMYSCASNSII